MEERPLPVSASRKRKNRDRDRLTRACNFLEYCCDEHEQSKTPTLFNAIEQTIVEGDHAKVLTASVYHWHTAETALGIGAGMEKLDPLFEHQRIGRILKAIAYTPDDETRKQISEINAELRNLSEEYESVMSRVKALRTRAARFFEPIVHREAASLAVQYGWRT